MSTRFFSDPLHEGMGRRWDEWQAPHAVAQAQILRWRASMPRPHLRLVHPAPLSAEVIAFADAANDRAAARGLHDSIASAY